jgi:hypothetical protein
MLARRMSADRIPAGRGIATLADIPDGECRDGVRQRKLGKVETPATLQPFPFTC